MVHTVGDECIPRVRVTQQTRGKRLLVEAVPYSEPECGGRARSRTNSAMRCLADQGAVRDGFHVN